MPYKRQVGPDGPYYVRPAYRPDDYRLDPNARRAIENWRNDRFDIYAMLEMHDGPFVGWVRRADFERDGKSWIRFSHLTGEYCVDVEVTESGLGEILPVDPGIAFELALAADPARELRVVRE